MAINTGLSLTYRPDYPVPGIDQSSQQFRDNFSVLKFAIEKLQLASSHTSSAMTVTTSLDASGNVKLAIGYRTDFGLRLPEATTTPVSGNLRYSSSAARAELYIDGTWRPLALGAVNLDGGGSSIVLNNATVNGRLTVAQSPSQPTDAVNLQTLNVRLNELVIDASAGNETITLSGDASGSGDTSIVVTLADSGVAAGTYNSVSVDSKGRVVAGSTTTNSATATALATARTIALTGAVVGSAVFDGTATASIAASLSSTGVTAGTYSSVTVDATGRITAGSIATVVATAQALSTARTISLTGPVTGSVAFDGSANAAISTTLADSGVAAGTYSKVTVDAKGRVTAGTPIVSGTGSALSGTVVIDSFLASQYRVARYDILLSGTSFQTSKLTVLHNGSVADVWETEQAFTETTPVGEFSVALASGTVTLSAALTGTGIAMAWERVTTAV